MITLNFEEPDGPQTLNFQPHLSLLDNSLENGIAHFHACGGNARCTTCRVQVLEGVDRLAPRNEKENDIARRGKWDEKTRLACQTFVRDGAEGNVTLRRLVQDREDLRHIGTVSDTEMGRETELAVMFIDLRKFTSFAEKHLPYDVIHILNRFFDEIGQPIFGEDGLIDNYTGDGCMALFGLQDASPRVVCQSALRAALGMQVRLRLFNLYLKQNFNHSFDMGVGIAYGPVIVGSVGHSAHRRLTVIGDTVNLASRVESFHRRTGASLLVSESFYEAIADDVQVGRAFQVEIKGKQGRHRIIEILDTLKPSPALMVQRSFIDALRDRTDFSTRFYENFWKRDERIRGLFANTDMRTQSKMLMDVLTTAIYSLGNMESIREDLTELARRHVNYGTQSGDYQILVEAFLETLRDTPSVDYSQELEDAWRESLGMIALMMVEGAA